MIRVDRLTKEFQVAVKDPGLLGSLRSFVNRKFLVKHALKNVSLCIEPGEIMGLVGANGAGKTTLVKILSGIVHPTSGEVEVLGHVPWKRETVFRKNISIIMGQKAQLWWDLPAADCFLLLREIYQIPEPIFKQRLDELVDELEVRGQLNVQIRKLSLGERMKMELIASMLHQPKVVFLDEPTIGLDLTSQRAIRKFLLNYRKRHRPAMILTSHYMEDIEELCERIVILREGSVIYDGSLDRVLKKHALHKILKIELAADEAGRLELSSFEIPRSLGEIISRERGTLTVKTLRESVSETAAFVLQKLKIVDLAVEEEDIGIIVENIMRKGWVD